MRKQIYIIIENVDELNRT